MSPSRLKPSSEGLGFEVEKRPVAHLGGKEEIVVILVFKMEDEDTGEKIEARAVLSTTDFAAYAKDIAVAVYKVAHPIIETPAGPKAPPDLRLN